MEINTGRFRIMVATAVVVSVEVGLEVLVISNFFNDAGAKETGIPCFDVLVEGADKLVKVVIPFLKT